jgi:hypothetical protein
MERDWLIPFAVLAMIEFAVAHSIAWAIDYPGKPDYLLHFAISAALGGALLFCFFAYHFIHLMRVMAPNPSRALAALWAANRARFTAVSVGLVFATLHGIAFNWSKSMLPFVVPFWADKPLADMDEALFGMAAWEWAYRITGSGSEAFRLAYVAWLPIAIALPVAVICMRASQRKAVLLTAYLLTWIIGGVLAFIFSSAGPLFYGPLGLGDRFLTLHQQAHLDTIPTVAAYLWDNYQNLNASPGAGISAFPSLHVAMACWFGLVLRHWAGWIFAGLIFFGSFLLGWHYFLDAPAGVAIAWAAYALAKRYHRHTGKDAIDVSNASVPRSITVQSAN